MRTSSALARLFVLSGTLIVFLFVRDPGLLTTTFPQIDRAAWQVKQPCLPSHGRFGCHVLQLVKSPNVAPDSSGLALFSRLRAALTPWRIYAQSTAPSGFSPADIQDAYKLNVSTFPTTPMIAVIVAYDDPNIESDLALYRSTFGLPACNGCLRKVNQYGQSGPLPASNRGWASETALAVEMVAAVCPRCDILLVEAQDDQGDGLFTSVNAAATLDAPVILAEYGMPETLDAPDLEATYFKHPNVAIVAPSGNRGYYGTQAQFPASSQYVTAVGGTTLTRATNARGWNESAWGSAANAGLGAGSGCSSIFAKPVFQTDTGCLGHRTVGDLAAVADPNTGVAIYDSYRGNGWVVYGGTDVAAAIVAGVFGRAESSAPFYELPTQLLYATPSALFDVTTGSNGACGSYLCAAQAGYDGPTGLGTPNGIAAFSPPADEFSLSISPAQATVDAGVNASALVTAQVVRGPAESVLLSVHTTSPYITAASISPSTINTGSLASLSVVSDANAPPGPVAIEVIARGTQAVHAADYTLTIGPLKPPKIAITVDPNTVRPGQSATVSWTVTRDPATCSGSRAWSGTKAFQGTQVVSQALPGYYTYELDCSNARGDSSASATLTVLPGPVVAIAVYPTQIAAGQTALLAWDAVDVKTCLASDAWTGSEALLGLRTISPKSPGTYRYTLTCSGSLGTAISSAVLTVQAPNQ